MVAAQAWFSAHQAALFFTLFLFSEALAQIPAVKANSVFQLVFGWLQKKEAAQPPSG